MSQRVNLLAFTLDGKRFGIFLEKVVRVVHAAEIVPLPGAPGIVMGVLDLGGRILPVLNLRRRLGLEEKELGLRDQFLIANTPRRTVAMVIDQAEEVLEVSSEKIVGASEIVPGLEHLEGVAVLDGGVVLIHDLDRFLSIEEETAIDEALKQELSHAR